MNFFDKLHAEKQAYEAAKLEAERQIAERERLEAEARAQAEQQRLTTESERKARFERAKQYLDQTGAENYAKAIVNQVTALGYERANIRISDWQPTMNKWTTDDVVLAITWDCSAGGLRVVSGRVIRVKGVTMTITLRANWEGTLTFGFAKVIELPLAAWSKNHALIDAAFDSAYHAPGESFHEDIADTSDRYDYHYRDTSWME